jgi:hypothetical protein
MDIIITEPLNRFATKLYQGQRWRYPSMTDVKFLDNEYIVAAHRYGCKVYILQKQTNAFVIVRTLTLTYNGSPYPTESFTIVNNTIYMISFTNVMTIIGIMPDYSLKQMSSIQLHSNDVTCHGIAYHDNCLYITPSKKTIGTEYIVSYNTLNGELKQITSLGDDIRVKNLTFLPNDLVVVIVNYKTKTTMMDIGHKFNGSIRLYTLDFKQLDSIEVPLTHFDDIVSKNNIFYATGADLEGGYIYKGIVEDNRFTSIYKHQTHDFPHGIDIKENTIAYTSYATSGIHFIDETELDTSDLLYAF